MYGVKCIKWTPKVLRQIRKIHIQKTKEKIYNEVGKLQDFPECSNIMKLKGREEYRRRVNQWRVIFRVSSDILYIEEVKKRDEHTY